MIMPNNTVSKDDPVVADDPNRAHLCWLLHVLDGVDDDRLICLGVRKVFQDESDFIPLKGDVHNGCETAVPCLNVLPITFAFNALRMTSPVSHRTCSNMIARGERGGETDRTGNNVAARFVTGGVTQVSALVEASASH